MRFANAVAESIEMRLKESCEVIHQFSYDTVYDADKATITLNYYGIFKGVKIEISEFDLDYPGKRD